MTSKNKPIRNITLGGLPTQNSRILPGLHEKICFFKESEALKDKPQNSRNSKVLQGRTSPVKNYNKLFQYKVKIEREEFVLMLKVLRLLNSIYMSRLARLSLALTGLTSWESKLQLVSGSYN